MSSIKETQHYILSDIDNNNNKFWNVILFDDGMVRTEWGRVGDSGQSKDFPGAGQSFFDSKIREKTRKGYALQHTLQEGVKTDVVAQNNLHQIATSQIETNSPETTRLIEFLIKQNIHNITESTTLTYNVNSGLFSTPLGIVDATGISMARTLLDNIAQNIVNKRWDTGMSDNINKHLKIIPQIIPRRGVCAYELFPDVNAVQKQNQILDSLDASLQVALSNPDSTDDTPKPQKRIFDAKLYVVEDGKVYDRINQEYRKTSLSIHQSSDMRLNKVFTVDIAHMTSAYKEYSKEIVNRGIGEQELWHGTGISNILSIIAKGFLISPPSTAHIAGKLIGNGCYFSDIATKSLNYSDGYWHGGSKSQRAYMFRCKVAMGVPYMLKYHTECQNLVKSKPGYDSSYAKKGVCSGLLNNEMVVYSEHQVNPIYLCEFTR
jgi:poly [ADP-ribose] polymerase 2/3/4